jgi:flavin reductase (DIM6/NTAB) family NADH-FMN oxidoreductase RutF
VSPKKIKTRFEKFQYFYPYTVALIGAQEQDKTNFMSCAWHTALSFDPPLFGVLISKKRFTHRLIADAQEFTVNFLAAEQGMLSAQYGRKSGRDMDKISTFPITLSPSQTIRSPVIDEAYVCFECRLMEIRTYGDHDLFVGNVQAIHEEEGCFDRQGVLQPRRIRPLLYLGSDCYLSVDSGSHAHIVPD